ncbi:class I SAM-dependent methyltransferase [Oricola cellulosilytica]|uniref:Class I SAM-dependent methyltransferase n=1 Tax=Oricola cellulosilytica TaxID=1429082 RepID=A0A4R0PD93_9HYPH|nr:class I SAM-dependent methyltransferase [Oricola cellulosilytica]TCD15461.1 class I SAM-dependent methyltransferase [Oricola cellulosilytica]
MSDTAAFWDKISPKYARRPVSNPEAYQQTLERTRSYLRPTDNVLELGCGTGTTALILSESAGTITASDLSPGMIRIAREKAEKKANSNTRFVTGDVFNPALGEGPYDVVLAFNLFHLLEDPGEAAARVHGLLKPGGLFISKTSCAPENGAPISYRAIRVILPVMQFFGKAPYVNFMRIRELEEAITSRGFKIIEVGNYPASPPSRFIVARKS